MYDLVQFFIESASRSGEALFGMICALLIVLALVCFTGYEILALIIGWFRNIKPIKIRRVEKIDKVVEVPKPLDNLKEYKEIIRRLDQIEKRQKGELASDLLD
ncbi:MAG: hypothetical protein ACTSW3_03680 [Promethearchaeota archaeon]